MVTRRASQRRPGRKVNGSDVSEIGVRTVLVDN